MAAKVPKGAAAMKRRLAKVRNNVFEALEQVLSDESEKTLALSRDLAPQLTGQMIATSGLSVDSRKSAGVIQVQLYYTERYALYQHEGTYNPGPVTSAKLGPSRGIGRKFLQRAVNRRQDEVIVRAGRAVERALRLTLR